MFESFYEAGTEMVLDHSHSIHTCCRDGDVQKLSMLLNSQRMLALSEDSLQNWAPIHWAAYFGQLDCVRQIVSVEPSTINMQSSKTFQTPLHCAAEGGRPHCVLWFLQAGSNPEVKDISMETALHKASRVGSLECVKLLMAVSSSLSCQNHQAQTASSVAEANGHLEIATFIRKHEILDVSGFQMRLPVSRSSRKRMRDVVCGDEFSKRFRRDDLTTEIVDSMDQSMSTSLLEHDNLCSVESGYRNTLLECMLSEFHGC